MRRDALYKAGWVIIDPWTIIENGYVRIENGSVAEVGQGRGPVNSGTLIDCGPGAILPGLINAHTHLELTALKGATNTSAGLIDWVESVIRLRAEMNPRQIIESASQGLESIRTSGTVLIGEIASLGITRELFETSPVNGVWFREYLGSVFPTERKAGIGRSFSAPDKSYSVSGHAPHTTAPDLLVALKKMADRNQLPFGLHLAESSAEVEFLVKGEGDWADFMHRRDIDVGQWPLPGKRPVPYCDQLNLLDEKTLAVHLLECDSRDIAILADCGVRACLCPRSNMILHKKLPDIPAMLAAGIRPCLGTDSLASNETLSLFDEMAFVARKFPALAPADILAMATINGAAALGFANRFGRLVPGATARFLYVPAAAKAKASLLEAIAYEGKDIFNYSADLMES